MSVSQSLKKLQSYKTLSFLTLKILKIIGNITVSNSSSKTIAPRWMVWSICILLFQLFVIFLHSWTSLHFWCCHRYADAAMLLRLIFPLLMKVNALLYQIIFLLSVKRIRNLLSRIRSVTATGRLRRSIFGKSIAKCTALGAFGILFLVMSWVTCCAISTNYAIAFRVRIKPCLQIYFMTTTPVLDNSVFVWKYTKLILQTTSISITVAGLLFSEYWVASIFNTLASAFDASHLKLVKILRKSTSSYSLKEQEIPIFTNTNRFRRGNTRNLINHEKDVDEEDKFSAWKLEYCKLCHISAEADQTLAPLILAHVLLTPVLLCLAGFQLLQKDQEVFMKQFNSKAVCYYLTVFCLLRMFILCNAGERLGKEAIGLINNLSKSEIYGLPNSVKFQMKLFITQAISQPSIMTACQFCTVSRPFFLTLVGTTFTCLVVFLQVKTNPAKFRAPGAENEDRFGC